MSAEQVDLDVVVALQEAVENESAEETAKLLADRPAPEVAAMVQRLARKQVPFAFRQIDRALHPEVFSYLEVEDQHTLLDVLDDADLREILAELSPDDRTALFEELEPEESQRLFNLLEPDDLKSTRDLLAYPEESVGRLMSPDYLSVPADWTVERALKHFRAYGEDTETFNIVYVIDQKGRLVDDVRLRRFILADPKQRVRELMDGSYVRLSADDDRERAVALMKQYDVVALPVVDRDDRLLGIVTVDDVFDVAEEETTEDIHKAAAMEPLRMSYRRAGVFTLFQRRFYWLAVLVVLNLVSSGIIAAYEEALQAAVALAFFIPLLIDSGGNSGSQAATMMIRALVIGEIHMRDWLRTLVKEIGVGVTLGAALAVLAGALGFYRGGWEIGVVVGLSMIAIIALSNIIGMSMPFVLNKLRVDPATASSPLITSICDAVGLLIYFYIASLVLAL